MVGGSTKKRECIENRNISQSDSIHVKTSHSTKLNCNSHFCDRFLCDTF